MLPDDPRHGTNAGYQAHRRDDEIPCPDCTQGRRRDRKRVQVEALAGTQMMYPWAEVNAVVEPWTTMGLGLHSLLAAAGLGNHRGSRVISAGRPLRRSSYLALAAVSEADFDDRAKVWSHLTAQRIGSLMAAGHRLRDMPVNERGQWRYRTRVSVGTARAIRDHFAEHQHQPGADAHTRALALNAGHRPPAAWDDPTTLAWPLGWTEPIRTEVTFDPVVVDRVIAGDWRLPATRAERIEAIRQWRCAGRSLNELERRTGWNIARDLGKHIRREEDAA